MSLEILKNVKVNLPLRMAGQYLGKYLDLGISPEIGIDAESMDNMPFEKAESIAKHFTPQGKKITMHGPFLDLNIASLDHLIRDISRRRIKQSLDYVDLFMPESIVFHSGYDARRHGYNSEEWMSLSLDFWTEIAENLSSRGVALHLENVYETGPEEIFPVVESVFNAGGGFCFDTGHCHSFGNGKMTDWLESLGDFIKEIHLHDNDGNNDLHLPPGAGNINFNFLLSFLSERDFLPVITLEPHTEGDLYPALEWLELNNVFK